ncbi:O-antigen polymerase [Aeromonas veronii]|uniref:O-antigen polymerase n=1 Tax=Aeromonas veronii TaxID=654 RepID=UPI003B9F54DB
MMPLIYIFLFLLLVYYYFSGKEIGFGFLFSFGALFYILTPYIIYTYGFFDGYPGIELWKESFNLSLSRYKWVYLYFFICSFVVVFIDFLFSRLTSNKVNTQSFYISHIGGIFALLFITVILLVFWFKSYQAGMLFQGYAVSYDTGLMGNMATANLFSNFMAIYFFLNSKRKLSLLFSMLIAINSIFLLSMGGRMYVVTIILPWVFIYLANRTALYSRVKILSLVLLLVLFMGIVGIWRLGMSDISFIGYITMAEAIFTSISISTFLHLNENVPFLENGFYFISSLMGVLPSFIFPDKAQLFISPEQLGYKYESPLGATSLVVSLFTSFGYLGGLIYIMFVGLFMNILRVLANKAFFLKTYYLCVLSIVPFIYFRETFYISNRIVIFPFLIMPLIFYFFDRILFLGFAKSKEVR